MMAEKVLGLTPEGTHDWEKFIDSEDLQEMVTEAGLWVFNVQGTYYNPLNNEFGKTDWLKNNYMLAAKKIV